MHSSSPRGSKKQNHSHTSLPLIFFRRRCFERPPGRYETRHCPGMVAFDSSTCHNDGVHEKMHMVFSDVGSFGPATDALHKFMHTPQFLKYLELATGIDGLVTGSADSDAGVHQILPQGFEKVHTDFNKDKQRALHRRVSVYLYLNPQWKSSYGGHLELWSRDLQQCGAQIVPDFGRLVVFASTDFSFHGHQSPLACPPNRSNTMLAMYYYTPGRPSHECLNDTCFKDHHERYRATRCPSCVGECVASN